MNKTLDERAALLCGDLAHATRLAILRALVVQEMNVAEISKIVGLAQPATSRHLARLRLRGLVTTRREAQVVFYQCRHMETQALIAALDLIAASKGRRTPRETSYRV